MNIHERMKEQTSLAKTYALDGAFHTAANILASLAEQVKAHAVACDTELEKHMAARRLTRGKRK